MNPLHVTTKTPDGIKVILRAMFKDLKPASAVTLVTIADWMASYRKAELKQRRRGLTWKQIAAGTSDPRMDEKVSRPLLSCLFGEKQPESEKVPASAKPIAVLPTET